MLVFYIEHYRTLCRPTLPQKKQFKNFQFLTKIMENSNFATIHKLIFLNSKKPCFLCRTLPNNYFSTLILPKKKE